MASNSFSDFRRPAGGRREGDEEPVDPFGSRASACGQMPLFLTATPLLGPPPFVKGQSLYSEERQPPAARGRGRGGRSRDEERGRRTHFAPMQSRVGTHCCRVQCSVAQCCTAHCCVVSCSAVLKSTVQCRVIYHFAV